MAQNPPGAGRPRAGPNLVRLALRLPYSDLSLSDKRGGPIELDDSQMSLALALIYGIGPNEPRLLQLDDAGRIVLAPGALTLGGVLVTDPNSGVQARVISNGDGAATNNINGLFAQAQINLWNGATSNRARDASAAVLAAQSGIGAALASPPGMWSAVSSPAAGGQATATQAAGGAGVRHVATGIIITWGAIAAPVATALSWALRDGASGAGTILAQGQLAVPAAVFQGQPVQITDIAIPGTPNTAMTLEFSAALANLLEGVTLLGFDAH